jgi:hypothetical protein
MIVARFAAFVIGVAGLIGLATASASAIGTREIEARFEVFGFAGLYVLSTRTRVEEGSYAIAIDIATRGLARVFIDLASHSEVCGTFVGDTFRPQAFRDGTDPLTASITAATAP